MTAVKFVNKHFLSRSRSLFHHEIKSTRTGIRTCASLQEKRSGEQQKKKSDDKSTGKKYFYKKKQWRRQQKQKEERIRQNSMIRERIVTAISSSFARNQ
jgi:hypothetical protein